jgi:hypothetical protein
MFKKILFSFVSVIILVVGGAFVFKNQLMGLVTQDMFIAQDTDTFDPGLAIGESFPVIKAIYQNREVDDVSEFIRDKGMIFIANRSADW